MSSVEVLMVEDNRGDIFLMREAMARAGLDHKVNVVTNGVDALDFLYRRGRFDQAPKPDLILLDLKLPRKGGKEVLAEMIPDPGLRGIPVMILTSSAADLEEARSFNLPGECYILKPSNFEGYMDIVRVMERIRAGQP